MVTIHNILVGSDFSETSRVALDYARALAHQFGARLHVMHVVETIAAGDVGVSGYAMAAPQMQARLEEEADQQLKQLVTDDDRLTLQARAVLIRLDTPAHAIVHYAESERIDLVVIGTHGRRGLTHLLMGSVAETIVRTAPCPVLTVRYPERDFVHPDALVKAV